MSASMKEEIQERFPEEYKAFLSAATNHHQEQQQQQQHDHQHEEEEEEARVWREFFNNDMNDWDDDFISNAVAEQENLHEYYQNLNMQGELVVCPLCYTWLTKKFEDDEEYDQDIDEEEVANLGSAETFSTSIDATRDPIRLLTKCAEGNTDGVKGCSHFLSTTMKNMHVHLTQCHRIPKKKLTRKSGCSGLLNNCKIRAADGLVQRYWRTVQQEEGDTKSKYWGAGCDRKRTVDVNRALTLQQYWGHDGHDRKSMYFDLLFSTQRKEQGGYDEDGENDEDDEGEDQVVGSRSSWSLLGERHNLFTTTVAKRAFNTLLEPYTTELHEDDRRAIVNDSDVESDGDVNFNHAALDRMLDEKNSTGGSAPLFALKIPEAGDIVEIRWDLEGGGERWYRAEVLQTTRRGGFPFKWKIEYDENHEVDEKFKFNHAEAGVNWRVVGIPDAIEEEEEEEEDEDDILEVNDDSNDDSGGSSSSSSSEDDIASEEEEGTSFPYHKGDAVKIEYDDGRKVKVFDVVIEKMKKKTVRVLYSTTGQTEYIDKDDFELRVVENRGSSSSSSSSSSSNSSISSSSRNIRRVRRSVDSNNSSNSRNSRNKSGSKSSITPRKNTDDDEDEDEDEDEVLILSSSAKKRAYFEDDDDDDDDGGGTSSSPKKKRRVTPCTKTVLALSSDDSDSELETTTKFSSGKKNVFGDDY